MSDTTENALIVLKDLIELNKTKAKKEKMKKRWDFRTSPHEQFGKEIDDTFMAFLLWARVSTDEDDTSSSEKAINVSKAFRRLESYAGKHLFSCYFMIHKYWTPLKIETREMK